MTQNRYKTQPCPFCLDTGTGELAEVIKNGQGRVIGLTKLIRPCIACNKNVKM